MGGHRDLLVWQRAKRLVKQVYEVTASFPRQEVYGVVAQMRGAAVSVPSNIAEGASRNSTGEFRQFIGNARGSLAELETQVEIAQDLAYLPENTAQGMLHEIDEISRMLAGLRSWSERAAS